MALNDQVRMKAQTIFYVHFSNPSNSKFIDRKSSKKNKLFRYQKSVFQIKVSFTRVRLSEWTMFGPKLDSAFSLNDSA